MTEPINTQGSSLNNVAEPTYQQGSNPIGPTTVRVSDLFHS